MTRPSDRTTPSSGTGRTINQTVALVFGVIYTLVGIAGFFVTHSDFASHHGESLFGFHVTIVHNIVHLLIGLALIGASRALAAARGANTTIGAVYVLLGVLGGLINDTVLDVLGLNTADHFLHFASGAVLLIVGLAADKARSTTRA